MMPFSLASRRLSNSFCSFLATMPLRCDSGMFFCSRIDPLLPRDNKRKSVALWRFLPEGSVEEKDESRRWDSLRRRCRAKSFLRFAASVPSSAVEASSFAFVGRIFGAVAVSEEGGFADWCESS